MIGAIIGDVVGSVHEFLDAKHFDAELFVPESRVTDDSVLTVATADAILKSRFYTEKYQQYAREYPDRGYGMSFMDWAFTNGNYITPNFSWGNGSAMRVSPVGWAFNTLQAVMLEAQQSACITHAHPGGLAGAQAIAVAVFLARHGATKDEIKAVMTHWFQYDVELNLDELNETYKFDVSCQGTVPVAIACALQADSFEKVLRNGLYVGGDTDTLLACAAAVAEPLYGVPDDLRQKAEGVLGSYSQGLLGIVKDFETKYGCGKSVKRSNKALQLVKMLVSIGQRFGGKAA